MLRHRCLHLALTLLAASACGGGITALHSPTARPTARSSGARSPSTAAAAVSPPPARIFVGSQTFPGIPVRYCRGASCVDLAARTPNYVSVVANHPVTFAVSQSAAQATLQIKAAGGTASSTVALRPGALMAWGPALAVGKYLVTLQARFPSSTVWWLFGVTIASG